MAEQNEDVPTFEATSVSSHAGSLNADFEYKLLRTEEQNQRLLRRELTLKFWIKIVAVTCAVLIISGMGLFLWHVLHGIFVGPVVFLRTPLAIVIVVTPLISITSTGIALIIAAFRRFEDGDAKLVKDSLKTGAGVFSSA